MSDCPTIRSAITRYVDGALASHDRRAVDRHVLLCEPCRARLSQEEGARRVLKQTVARRPPLELPPGLETRCRALVAQGTERRAGFSWRWFVPATAAALILLAVVSLPIPTRQSNELLAAQLSADHVQCFTTLLPAEAAGVEVAAVEQQLVVEGRRMKVPPPSPELELQLIGVRRCVYGDEIVPHVMYTVRGRPLSLFALDEGVRPSGVVDALGQQCHVWNRDGRTFAMVAPEDAGSLTAVARYLEREAR